MGEGKDQSHGCSSLCWFPRQLGVESIIDELTPLKGGLIIWADEAEAACNQVKAW